MPKRPPTEKITINITRNQYDRIINNAAHFYDNHPLYDLTPDNEGDYNCVTAARALLQSAGIDYLNNIQTPFGVKYKIHGGQSSHVVESLLTTRDDFDANNKELIRYFEAFVNGDLGSKDLLAHVLLNARRPLSIPFGSQNAEFADFYLNVGGGSTPLHQAARFGHMSLVRFEVEQKAADVRTKNAFDNQPIHFAARNGRLDVIEYLVRKGADANALTKLQSTPLHYAALGGHLNVVRHLIERHRADMNAFDELGTTPLHFAASSGNLDLIKYLISKGGDVNAQTLYGDTLLSHAVSKGGNLVTVKYLINHGAIVSLRSINGGPTTLHYAALGGRADIVRYLVTSST